MLVHFAINDYRIFASPNDSENKLFMVGSKISKAPKVKGCGEFKNILTMGAIFGENHGGKSSLIDALKMLQDGIVNGTPFPEDGRFEIGFLANERPFNYAIDIKNGHVNDRLEEGVNGNIESSYFSNEHNTSIIYNMRNDVVVSCAYDWFKNKLHFVEPKSNEEIRENWSSYREVLKEVIGSFVPETPNHLSSGEKRIIEVSELFTGKDNIVVCDDFGMNLHPLITVRIIDKIRERWKFEKINQQFIFTSHESTLWEEHLHPDEIHRVCRRGEEGKTRLLPLTIFKDYEKLKDLRKSYLNGRFGGTP